MLGRSFNLFAHLPRINFTLNKIEQGVDLPNQNQIKSSYFKLDNAKSGYPVFRARGCVRAFRVEFGIQIFDERGKPEYLLVPVLRRISCHLYLYFVRTFGYIMIGIISKLPCCSDLTPKASSPLMLTLILSYKKRSSLGLSTTQTLSLSSSI